MRGKTCWLAEGDQGGNHLEKSPAPKNIEGGHTSQSLVRGRRRLGDWRLQRTRLKFFYREYSLEKKEEVKRGGQGQPAAKEILIRKSLLVNRRKG